MSNTKHPSTKPSTTTTSGGVTGDNNSQFLTVPKGGDNGRENNSVTTDNKSRSRSGKAGGGGFYLTIPSSLLHCFCCCCSPSQKQEKSYRLSLVKLLSVCGIIVSVLLLVALVIIFPQTFNLRSQVDNFVYKTTKDVLVIQQIITSGLHLKAYLNVSDESLFDQNTFIIHPSESLTNLLKYNDTEHDASLMEHLVAHQNFIQSMLSDILKVIPDKEYNRRDLDRAVVSSELFQAYTLLKNSELKIFETNSTSQAIALMEGAEYEGLKAAFEKKMTEIENLSLSLSNNEDNWMSIYTIVITSVTVVAFIVVLPVMIFLFMAALNKEALNRERLKKAKAVMLLDVMNDTKLRELFKQHCKQEHSSENYEVLMRTNLYRDYSRQIWEMQDILFTDTSSTSGSGGTGGAGGANSTDAGGGGAKSVTSGNDTTDAISTVSSGDHPPSSVNTTGKPNSITSGSVVTTTGTSGNANSSHKKAQPNQANPVISFNDGTTTDNKSSLKKKKRIKNVTEEEYKLVCNKRFELANEILTDFLKLDGKNSVNVSKRFADQVESMLKEYTLFEVGGDHHLMTNPEKKMNDQLPDDLFETLQNEIAVVMLDTLQRFKLGVQFQRKMKIDKVVKEREKKASTSTANNASKSTTELSKK